MPGIERGKFHGEVAFEQRSKGERNSCADISKQSGLEVSGMLKKHQEGQCIWSRKNEDERNRR